MIMQSTELSPSQKAAIEELIGRTLLEDESISLDAFVSREVSDPARQAAIRRLREFLERPRRAAGTDAEIDAAITEAMRTGRPGYTPVS